MGPVVGGEHTRIRTLLRPQIQMDLCDTNLSEYVAGRRQRGETLTEKFLWDCFLQIATVGARSTHGTLYPSLSPLAGAIHFVASHELSDSPGSRARPQWQLDSLGHQTGPRHDPAIPPVVGAVPGPSQPRTLTTLCSHDVIL